MIQRVFMAAPNSKYYNTPVTTHYFCSIRSHHKYNLVHDTIIFTDFRFDSAAQFPPGYLQGLLPGIKLKDKVMLDKRLDFKWSYS